MLRLKIILVTQLYSVFYPGVNSLPHVVRSEHVENPPLPPETSENIQSIKVKNTDVFEFLSDVHPSASSNEAEIFKKMIAKRNRFQQIEERAREDGYQKTEAREHPYSVIYSIAFSYQNKSEVDSCSGTLITLEWVLTAAHCFAHHNTTQVTVYAGMTKTWTADNIGVVTHMPAESQFISSKEWYVHPDHKLKLRGELLVDFDLALIKLPKPFKETEFVKSINLAEIAQKGYRTCSITAFGLVKMNDQTSKDNFVRKTHRLEVGTPCECEPWWRANYGLVATTRLLCAKRRRDFGLCSGDSGGGLICDGLLAGVTSFGINVTDMIAKGDCNKERKVTLGPNTLECGDAETLSVFQATQPSLAWIKTTANLTSRAARTCSGSFLIVAALWLGLSVGFTQ